MAIQIATEKHPTSLISFTESAFVICMQEAHADLMKLAVINGTDVHVEPAWGSAGAWCVELCGPRAHSTQQCLETSRALTQ